MLLVLTRREACRQALRNVLSAMPGWQSLERPAVFAASFAEAHRAPRGGSTLVIDLASVPGTADELVAAVRRLLATRPWLSVVLLTANLDPVRDAHVILGLRDVPSLDLVQAHDLGDPDRWRDVLRDHFVDRHARAIEADLRAACTGAEETALVVDPEVRRLLRLAARVGRVEALSAASGAERVGVWRRFKRHWGRTPSEMLSVFRVLWAAYLRAEGYSSADIAGLLGYRDAQQCARSLGTRLGMRKSQINALDYRSFVASVVTCLAQRAPVRVLVARAAGSR